MLDRDWLKLPKVALEALLERFNDCSISSRAYGARKFDPFTLRPYGLLCSLSERPNAQRREEARARVTTLYGSQWSEVDSPYFCTIYFWPLAVVALVFSMDVGHFETEFSLFWFAGIC